MPVKKSILIVGDDQNLYQTMAFILNRAGYLVAAGINLDEAHLYLQNSRYDLVILDVKMLDASISSAIQNIAHLIPNTPLLILSGNATNEIEDAAKVSTGSEYLVKPIDPNCILKRVQKMMS
jgi:DNA-binding response OmpR family regulator